MSTGIKVRDAMVSPAVIIGPDSSVKEAATMMQGEDVGSLVVTVKGKPTGIITREDLVNKIIASGLDPKKVLVKHVMSSDLITASPDEDIADVARKISKTGFERLPVVDGGNIVGIISTREIARVAPAAIEILRERLLMESGME